MDIKTVLHIEADNVNTIHLFKEGIFWKAYERSAYIFTQNIKAYNIKKKYYKNVNTQIVFLGFPDSALSQVISANNTKEINTTTKQISIKGFSLDVSAFDIWKKEIELAKITNAPVTHHSNIIKEVMGFDVLNKTPLDCQAFLIGIQKVLNGTIC